MLLRRPRHDNESEQGQIIVLFAMVLVLVMVFTALVVDVGLLRNDRQRLINAMDAGALAGGALLPVDGSLGGSVTLIEDLIEKEINASFPGLVLNTDYFITFRCLIGADANGNPLIERDIPSICSPQGALGLARTATPPASAFIGAGTTRSSECDPTLGDKCNVVQVRGAVDTQYYIGPVIGVDEGSTGSVVSAACNGPCGQPVAVPLDVVMVMDRTYSMVTPTDLTDELKDAGYAVLEAYNPEFQHIALGMLGPSSLSTQCSGSPSGIHATVIQEPVQIVTAGPPVYQTQTNTNPSNSNVSSLTINRPSNTANDDVLVATIAYRLNSGSSNVSGVDITAPTGWTLINETNQGSGATSIALATFYRVGGGGTSGNPAAYTFNFSTAGRASGGIMRFSNVDTANPIINKTTNSGDHGTTNNQNMTATGINGVPANSMLIATYARSATTSISQPNNWSERYNTTGNAGPSVSADTRAQSGNIGNLNATGGNQEWAAQMIALRTASAADVWTPDEYGTTYGGSYNAANAQQWIPVQLSGTEGEAGPAIVDEAYNDAADDPEFRTLDHSTQIVRAIDCMQSAQTGYPGTNLKTPIEMATAYLNQYGRPDVKKGIILETDGVPQYAQTGDASNYTCGATNTAATAAKNAGIEIYTIGFFRESRGTVNIPNCISDPGYGDAADLLGDVAGKAGSSNTTVDDCSARENTDGDNFYCASSGADLRAIFLQVATKLAEIKPRLVHTYPIPIVSSVSPPSGGAGGGNVVTITGKYFTGADRVVFGGANLTPNVTNDRTLWVTVPPGTAGSTVHVQVRTPGGISPIVPGDRYTYSP